MGLFGKLFEKKECSICGGEIGLLGNRKLKDGNMCKNCAKKLSPLFDERRESTLEQIKDHLAYRERNKEVLAAFNPTRTIGKSGEVVYVDEDTQMHRLMESNHIDKDAALHLMKQQMSIEDKKQLGDYIVDNRFNHEDLYKNIERVLKEIKDDIIHE